MNFNNIGAINKTGQKDLDFRFENRPFEQAAHSPEKENTPASKTYLTASPNQAKIKDPYQELSDFMKMTDAQKMQYLWLKKNGISPEEFEAMSDEDKQKLIDRMQEEIKTQVQKAVESPEESSLELI